MTSNLEIRKKVQDEYYQKKALELYRDHNGKVPFENCLQIAIETLREE